MLLSAYFIQYVQDHSLFIVIVIFRKVGMSTNKDIKLSCQILIRLPSVRYQIHQKIKASGICQPSLKILIFTLLIFSLLVQNRKFFLNFLMNLTKGRKF